MLIIMTEFNPATMNPAAIILPTQKLDNTDDIYFYVILFFIFLLIGYMLIKRYIL
jgi:hypothetical protein